MARDRGLAIDREGFEREMERQRVRARASWKGAEKGAVAPAYQELVEQGRTRFLGYEDLASTSVVKGLVVERRAAGRNRAGRRSGAGPRPHTVLRRDRRPGGRSRQPVCARTAIKSRMSRPRIPPSRV